MTRFRIRTIILPFLAVAFCVTATNSYAGFTIGPDGNAYQLVDCQTAEDGQDDTKCPGQGNILWSEAVVFAQNFTFQGFPCHLATPSTAEVNTFLKTFTGFSAACVTTGITNLELCAWFGAYDPTDNGTNGPYRYIGDPNNDIPCPFNAPVACNPIVDPGVGTDLTFQDWCRTANGCGFDEPNGLNETRVGYLRYTNTGTIGWHDCTDICNCCGGPFPSSYFVECPLPPERDINVSVIAICAAPDFVEPHDGGDGEVCLCFGRFFNGFNATGLQPNGQCARSQTGPFCFVDTLVGPLFWKETVTNQSDPTTVGPGDIVQASVSCPPGKMVLSCEGAVTVGNTTEVAANVASNISPSPNGLACRHVARTDSLPPP